MNKSFSTNTVINEEAVTGGLFTETKSFKWEIKNFNVIRKFEDLIKLQRFQFTAGESSDYRTEWEFQLDLNKANKCDKMKEQMWIGCILRLTKVSVGLGKAFASWQFQIKNIENDTTFSSDSSDKVYEYKEETIWQQDYVVPQNLALKDLPLKNGCLIIELTVQIYTPQPICKDVSSTQERYKSIFIEKLQQDFAKLMACPLEGSGVTKIVVMGDDKFNVTSNILSSRSPVFKMMFESKMIEDTTRIVQITDISSKTMEVLLSFLHTGKLQPEWRHPDVIAELVYAAAKYQLSDLLEFLNEVVGSVCTKENAGKLMSLARKLSLKKAENDLWDFVKKNVTTLDEMIAFCKIADCADDFIVFYKRPVTQESKDWLSLCH